MRSHLFVPADSENKLVKALKCGADCLFLDLEDSVALAAKPKARNLCREFLAAHISMARRPKLYVRVNALDSGEIDADLDAVMPARPDGVLLPKAQGGPDVQHLSVKLAVHEANNDVLDGTTKIICVATETASAIFGLPTYRAASRRLVALTWGAEDLSADLGAETNRLENGEYSDPYRFARTLTLLAAISAEVAPIDSVYPNFKDERGFVVECQGARRDGFVGKMAIHPAQIPIINEIFTPPVELMDRAKKIVQAFADNPHAGVIAIEGEMFDKPHLERAKKLLARNQAAKLQ